mgnify:CR=1 FL=1
MQTKIKKLIKNKMVRLWNLRKEKTKLQKFSALLSMGLIFALALAVYGVLGIAPQEKNNETETVDSQDSIGETLLKSVSKKKKKSAKKKKQIKMVAGSTFVASSEPASVSPLSCPGDSQLMWNGQRFYCLPKTDHYSSSIAVTGDATKTITIARNGTTDISTIFVDKDTLYTAGSGMTLSVDNTFSIANKGVTNDMLVGTDISTVGTITSGVWNGSTIAVSNGGTGSTNGSINGTGELVFSSGGTNQNIVLMPSGTGGVGIGVTAPTSKLEIKGTNSEATIDSADKAINGNFATSASWIFGTGWSFDAVNFEADHAVGNTADLEEDVSAVSGEVYQVTFTVKNLTSGQVVPSIGGGVGTAVSSNSTSIQYITAVSSGNLKFTPLTNFDGSIDNIIVKKVNFSQALISLRNSDDSVNLEIRSSTTSFDNTYIGKDAGKSQLANVGENTAVGKSAMMYNTTGYYNNAFGSSALKNNTSGVANQAFGRNALSSNTTGWYNVGIGYQALQGNISGQYNTAVQSSALLNNTTGNYNLGIGFESLKDNTTGSANIALGHQAGYSTTGSNNQFIGYQSGYNNSAGSGNVFLGHQAGYYETGSNKLFIDNTKRASESDARSKALVYGVFDDVVDNQMVKINGGLVVGAPSGGNQGAGTINAEGLYAQGIFIQNTVPFVPDYVFDKYYDGVLKPEDALTRGDYNIMTIDQMEEYTREHHHLPTIPGRNEWQESGNISLGVLTNHLWETVETQAIYVAELNNRTKVLEVNDNNQLENNNQQEIAQEDSEKKIGELETKIADLETKVASFVQNSNINDNNSASEEPSIEKDDSEVAFHISENVLSFLKEVLFSFKVTFEKAVTFLSDATFKGDVKFEGEIEENGHAISGNEAGIVKIEKGEKSVEVNFAKAFAGDPVVIVSPIAQTAVYSVEEISSKGFKIKLSEEADEDIKFNWIAQMSTEGFSASDAENENNNSEIQSESPSENTNSSLPKETVSQSQNENQNDNVSQNDNSSSTEP